MASADREGNAYLVPLSFLWNGTTLTVATPEDSLTGRNLHATGRTRLALGTTRDVVIIDGTVEAFSLETVPPELADEFAAKRWEARTDRPRYGYFRITPNGSRPGGSRTKSPAGT